MHMAHHLVKLIHASELQILESFPVYEANSGKTLALLQAEVKAGNEANRPVLFISHRWESDGHPDPTGRQLKKLKALKDCYIIYDYSSFPQDQTTEESRKALQQVLNSMNDFIDNVMILSDATYMTRGWCLYEYISASLRYRIICDEINDPALVRLRNVVATRPNPPGIGSTHREAVNAKNQFVLEAVNAVLPVFVGSGFTKPKDKPVVQRLLMELLRNNLPLKQEYMEYVGEWKAREWTTEELAAAFESELKWEPLQYDHTIPIFKPAVPDTIVKAVVAGYEIKKQPEDFGQERYELDMSSARWIVPVIKVVGVIILLFLLWGLYRFVRWIF